MIKSDKWPEEEFDYEPEPAKPRSGAAPGSVSMPIYYNNRFTGHYPVGTSAIVRAPDQERAASELNDLLKANGLPGDAKTEEMVRVDDIDGPFAIILQNGAY